MMRNVICKRDLYTLFIKNIQRVNIDSTDVRLNLNIVHNILAK